jgi:hypothetical protein
MSSIATPQSGYLQRPQPDELADIVSVMLDKGVIVDSFVRLTPIGTEVLTVDSRITSGSFDAYLRFAGAVDDFDIYGR